MTPSRRYPTRQARARSREEERARLLRHQEALARGREEAKATRAARIVDPEYVSPAQIRLGQSRYAANEVRAAAHIEVHSKVGLLDRAHITFEDFSTPGSYSNARRRSDVLPLKLLSIVGLIAWLPAVLFWGTLSLLGRGIYQLITLVGRLVKPPDERKVH